MLVDAWTSGGIEGVAIALEPLSAFFELSDDEWTLKKWLLSLFSTFAYLKKYKRTLCEILFLSLLTLGISFLIPFFLQKVMDDGIGQKNMHFVVLLLMGQLALYIGRQISTALNNYLLYHTGLKVGFDISTRYIWKLVKLPVGLFDTKLGTDLLQRLSDEQTIRSFLTYTVSSLLFIVLNLLVYMDYSDIFDKYGNSTCIGLTNGRCGLVLLAFLLSEKDEAYKKKASIHLDYLLQHVYESSSLSFSEGLLGIGWTLEFLTQNQYISTSYDNLLSDIDDIIYKWVNFHGVNTVSIDNGYLGCLLYLCYRLKGRRISTPYRELSLKECTIRILGKIYSETKRQEMRPFTGIEWRQLHVLVGLFKRMNIQNHITTDLLKVTRGMTKQTNYKFSPRNDFNLMERICLLFATSKRYRVVKNFFLK